jgi:3-oxoacyl-[acyl-carrier-protein] synthase-3
MVGDAAAVTILERSDAQDEIFAAVHMDGTRSSALQIPAGGMRLPYGPSSAELVDVGDGNMRAPEHFYMEGSEVFNFVLSEVPGLVNELLELSGRTKDEIEHFLFHQPNRFILQKLTAQLGVPAEKVPSNIVENFGNASSVTIPTNIAFNLGNLLERESRLVCIAGFGVGLTWGGMVMRLGDLDFCRLDEVDL